MDREIAVDKDYTLRWYIYDKAILVLPTTATISIYDNAGSAIVSGASCSSSTNGGIYYTFGASDNDEKGKNFKAVLTYVSGGSSYTRVVLFDVVQHPLSNVVSDYDLYDFLPEMRDDANDYSGIATADGTTSIIYDSGLYDSKVDYTGGTIRITVNDTTSYMRRISAYSSSAGTITLDDALPSQIVTGDRYTMRPAYQSLINKAFEIVRKAVRAKVGQSSSYIDGNVIKDAVIYKTLNMYCMGNTQVEGDKYFLLAEKFGKDYENELQSIHEAIDLDGDGNISDYEDDNKPNLFSIGVTL